MKIRRPHKRKTRPPRRTPPSRYEFPDARIIADSLPVLISYIDRDHRYRFCNRSYATWFGIEPQDIYGKTMAEVLGAAAHEKLLPHIRRVLGGEPLSFEADVPYRSGGPRSVRADYVPHRSPDGSVAGFFAMIEDVTERMRDRTNLQVLEGRLKALYDQATVGIAHADTTGRFISANRRYCEIVGRTEEELRGLRMQDITHSEDIPGNIRLFENMLREGTPFEIEKRYVRPGGEAIWVLNSVTPFREPDGRIAGTFSVTQDISHRRRAEITLNATTESLKRERERLAVALQAGRLGVYEWNVRDNTVWWSPEVYPVYGADPATFVPTVDSFASLVHPADREELWRKTREAIERRAVFEHEYRIIGPDGAVRWIANRSHVSLGPDGEVERVTGIAADVTERRQSEERLRILVSSIDDHLVTYDDQWRYTFVNDAAVRVLGKPREELLGRRIWDVFPESVGNQYYRELHEAAREKRAIRSEHYYPPFDVWFENHIYPSENGVTVFSADITARKRAEAALLRSNAELEQFAYVSSHDLKEPLRKISSFSQLLASRYKNRLDPEADQFINRITESVARMQGLIDDLLAYSRIGKTDDRSQDFELSDVLAETLHDLEAMISESGAQVASEELPGLRGNPREIRQVLQNLLSNGIKFRSEAPPRVRVSCRRQQNEWVIGVHDNGIGIEPQYFSQVFRVFQRLHGRDKYPGTGIGLAICKKIIEKNGGRIWVESQPGKGSSFYFTLPR